MTQSRRAFCSLLSATLGLASDKIPALPSEAVRYKDPATEETVVRLTSPASTSRLPFYYGRGVSRRGTFLLYSSDRSGAFQAYRMDLKTGQSFQLTDLPGLMTGSPTLMPDERTFCFVADGWMRQINLSNQRERKLYAVSDGFQAGDGFSVSEDGLYAVLVERDESKHRIRLISIPQGSARTVLESDEELSTPIPRPGRAGLLYRKGPGEVHVVSYDGAQDQRLRVSAGSLGPVLWSSDGRAVEYLNFPEDKKKLNNIREYVADANEDRLVAATTQYVHFGRNGDSSVFTGASGSKASPYLLLLVRSVKRELTLCEHKASDPQIVAPRFSPNSQRVFFQTDRHGKLAIYSILVDRLVAETE